LLAGLILGAGCLSRPALNKQSFAFPIAPIVRTNPAPPRRVLEIRRIAVAAPFDGQSFVYRRSAYAYERDPYAEFLVPPAEILAPALRGAFLQGNIFDEVTLPGSALPADYQVEIYVTELDGDFRRPAAPTADLGIAFLFFDAKDARPGTVLFQREYHEQVPFHPRTAAALVPAWNQALNDIMTQLNGDLRQVRFR
jgi:ABC-type uncharacterized transport system auxiliary subunit